MALDLPIVSGLTETAKDGGSLHQKLVDVMSQRPAAGRTNVAQALALLEEAFALEGDEQTRDRIAAGIGLLRGTKSVDGDD